MTTPSAEERGLWRSLAGRSRRLSDTDTLRLVDALEAAEAALALEREFRAADTKAFFRQADELQRLHSWEGLMELLDEHWPDDLFPTLEDGPERDDGARIVSLIRWVNRLRNA